MDKCANGRGESIEWRTKEGPETISRIQCRPFFHSGKPTQGLRRALLAALVLRNGNNSSAAALNDALSSYNSVSIQLGIAVVVEPSRHDSQ